MTLLAGKFKRAIDGCEDSYFLSNFKLTHATYERERSALRRGLAIGFAHMVFGRIGKQHSCAHMGNVARNYTNLILIVRDMAEIMDPGCERLLDEQFLEPLS